MNNQSVKLAEMLYYTETQSTNDFNKLEQKEKDSYITRIERVLGCVDQMDLVLAPKVNPDIKKNAHLKNIQILTQIIDLFVKGDKNRKIKGLQTTAPAFFPSGELAHRIFNFGGEK